MGGPRLRCEGGTGADCNQVCNYLSTTYVFVYHRNQVRGGSGKI